MSPFSESAKALYYQTTPPASPLPTTPSTTNARAQGIEVNITPEMLCPFLPSAAKPAHEIKAGPAHLPYISLVDLVVFKMDACGLRDSPVSKQHEVRDAAALLELATKHSALSLNDDQTRVVEESLADVLRHAAPDKQTKAWWQARLKGKCDPDARKPATEVLANLIEGMSLDESAKKAPADADAASWQKGFLGRTSSSSSKASLSSTCSSTSGSLVTSPMTPTTPTFPTHSRAGSKDLTMTGPTRPRKFSTSQNNPVKTPHSRKKSVDYNNMPRRHSQVLDDGYHVAPGLAMSARFESTPDDDKLITGSFL